MSLKQFELNKLCQDTLFVDFLLYLTRYFRKKYRYFLIRFNFITRPKCTLIVFMEIKNFEFSAQDIFII